MFIFGMVVGFLVGRIVTVAEVRYRIGKGLINLGTRFSGNGRD